MKKIFIIFATLFVLSAVFADGIGMSIGGGFKSSFYKENLKNENIPKEFNYSKNVDNGIKQDIVPSNIISLGVFIKFDILKDYQMPKIIVGWSMANEISFQSGSRLSFGDNYIISSHYKKETFLILENIEDYTLLLAEYRAVPSFMIGNKIFKIGLGVPVTFSFDISKTSGIGAFKCNWNSTTKKFSSGNIISYDSSEFAFYQGIGLRPQIEFCVKRFKIGGFFEFNGSLYQVKHLNKKYTKEADICSENSTTFKFFPKNSIKMSVGIYTTFIL